MPTLILNSWLIAPALAFLVLTQSDTPGDDTTAAEDAAAQKADSSKDAADDIKKAAPTVKAGGSGHTRQASTAGGSDQTNKPSN